MTTRKNPALFVTMLLVAATQVPGASAAVSNATISTVDANEISSSYNYLTGEFYQKLDTQTILDSVRTQLTTSLQKHHAHATLPALRAASSASANVRAIDREVEAAARVGGTSFTAHDASYAAIAGMMESVHDRYTVFLDPRDFAALNQGLDGSDFGGVGLVLTPDDPAVKTISVANLVPGGPADKGGLQQDDVILSIDEHSTKGMMDADASKLLRGKPGTKVTLMIERAGKPMPDPIVLTRATIHQPSVFEKMLPNNIGYVALSVFGRSTGDEFATALDRLQKRGARALVLDLRENGGGYIGAALAVSSKFISSGPIVSVESRGSDITTLEADNTAISPLPLAVLVDGNTASASEITSGAIQDSGVGVLIGTKTFGKGVVQTIHPLPDGSAVKITSARYFTPNNRDINHHGIVPDIVVALKRNSVAGDPNRDLQLKRALEFLDDRIARSDQ